MASLPQVGLEAVIAGMGAFQSAAGTILGTYDRLEKGASHVAKTTTSSFVDIGNGVLNFGAIAGGAALVGVAALTAGIAGLGAMALSETSKYERMSLSITNLVAREISQGKVVEEQRSVLASLTAKETAELEKLKGGLDNEVNSRDVLTAQIQEQKQKIIDLTAQYGDQGLVVIKERAELQGMELDLADLNKEISDHQTKISDLTGKEGQLVTVMEKVRVGQMSMSDAMGQAGPKAQELLKWIQILAIQSPFNQEDIANSFRTALAYGFTTEKAQRLTTAMVDFTSATGKTGESANLIALALGQIQARGKLSAQELRQLSEQGVGVNAILDKMGFSLDDVTNGLVNTDEFIEAVVKDMEIFKGAGKAQSNTLAGLTASMEDLKGIALREFFTGTFSAIRPYVSDFVGWLTNAAVQTGQIKKLGESIGQYVGGALKTISEYTRLLGTLGAGAGLSIMVKLFGPQGIALWKQVQTLMSNISVTFKDWKSALGSLLPDFSEMSSGIIPSIVSGLTFLNEHFTEFKGALIGIGAVLATGVFAALVAGMFALLTPINLIIVGAALLGAAWAGNWYGIQETTYAVWGTIEPIFNNIVNAFGSITEAFQSGGFAAAIDVVLANISLLGNSIQTALLQAWPGIQTTLTGWGTQFWNWVVEATKNAGSYLSQLPLQFITWANSPEVQGYLSQAGQMIGQHIITSIGTFFSTGGPGLVTALLYLAVGLLAAVATIAGTLFNLGVNLVAGILSGILESLGADLQPATLSELGAILTGIGTDIMIIAGTIGKNIVKGITDGWNSMVQNISTTITTGVNSWKKIITETKWVDIGASIIKGILKGINDNVSKVLEVLKDMAKEAIADAMDFFGISSPSTVFQEIGQNVVQGFVQGITSGQGLVQSAYDKLFKIDRSVVSNQTIGKYARQQTEHFQENQQFDDARGELIRKTLENIFKVNGKEILAAADPIKDMQDRIFAAMPGYRKADITAGMLRGSARAFVEAAIKGAKAGQAQLQKMIIEASESAVSMAQSLTDYAQEEANRLTDQIDTLDYLIEVANGGQVEFEGNLYSSIEAQALFNQKLEEQKRIQDDLVKLKESESKLGLLEKQLDLITQVSKAGLNIEDIFGGIKFGLDASIADVIEATNKVVQAMIAQVNKDLQIASPSKVMMKVGAFMNQGLAKGIINTMNVPLQALNNIINVPAGQAGVSNNSTVNNYNFDMKVNSGAQPQAVVQQFQTMRAMVS